MTQLALFDPPPAVGVLYAVMDRLSGDAVETFLQRVELDRLCADANARFGRIARRAPDADPRWCCVPEELRGELRYVVEKFSEEGHNQ